MWLQKMILPSQSLGVSRSLLNVRSLSPQVRNMNQKWREENGLPMNPNAYGTLTDKPDYTFLDGRATPFGVKQRERILKQKEITCQIMTLTKEVDFAVERHAQLNVQKEEQRQFVLNSKLKPKGLLLLKQK